MVLRRGVTPAVVVGLAALVSLVSRPGTGDAAPALSGLHGQVRKGPITPVCRVDRPCDAPAAGMTLTFTRANRTILTVRTDAKGMYRALLPGAIYTVLAPRWRGAPAPQHVKVRVGHLDRLDFYLDTGIR